MDQTAILNYVNKARKIQGLKPLKKLLKGVKEDGFTCPLTRSLNALYVGDYTAKFNDYSIAKKIEKEWWNKEYESTTYPSIKIPKVMERFIEAFDLGDLPEFELKGNRVR